MLIDYLIFGTLALAGISAWVIGMRHRSGNVFSSDASPMPFEDGTTSASESSHSAHSGHDSGFDGGFGGGDSHGGGDHGHH